MSDTVDTPETAVPPVVDHCAEAERLRGIMRAIASGESVSSSRFGEDEVRFFKGDLDELKRQIATEEQLCRVATGQPRRRRRFCIVGRAGSY